MFTNAMSAKWGWYYDGSAVLWFYCTSQPLSYSGVVGSC
jgi:hypothetical protein